MDPDLAGRLPEPYARALALVASGMTAVELARELDIDPDAIAVFLDIAAKKAARATLPPDLPPTIDAPSGASPTNHGASP